VPTRIEDWAWTVDMHTEVIGRAGGYGRTIYGQLMVMTRIVTHRILLTQCCGWCGTGHMMAVRWVYTVIRKQLHA
jgi:hypothetical protein